MTLYQDFPEDPTGNLDHLKDFVKDNFDICKWIGLTVVALQVYTLPSPTHSLYYASLSYTHIHTHTCTPKEKEKERKGRRRRRKALQNDTGPLFNLFV